MSKSAGAAYGGLKKLATLVYWTAKLAFEALAYLAKLIWRLGRGAYAAVSAHATSAISQRVKRSRETQPKIEHFTEVKRIGGELARFEQWLYGSKSSVGIIIGARGSGKSGVGARLLENMAAQGRKVYAMGFAKNAMPSWVEVVDAPERVPNGAAFLVDEGGILFGSRASPSAANKLLSQMLFVGRHKDLTLIFISQNSANIDVNALRQADYLLLKRPSLLQKDFERKKIKEIYDQASQGFAQMGERQQGLVYVYSDNFTGFAANKLPSFWSESASKSFGGVKLGK